MTVQMRSTVIEIQGLSSRCAAREPQKLKWLIMPLLDGATAIKEICASVHSFRDVPVIVTADATGGDRERYLVASTAINRSPFSQCEVLSEILRKLSLRKSQSASRSKPRERSRVVYSDASSVTRQNGSREGCWNDSAKTVSDHHCRLHNSEDANRVARRCSSGFLPPRAAALTTDHQSLHKMRDRIMRQQCAAFGGEIELELPVFVVAWSHRDKLLSRERLNCRRSCRMNNTKTLCEGGYRLDAWIALCKDAEREPLAREQDGRTSSGADRADYLLQLMRD